MKITVVVIRTLMIGAVVYGALVQAYALGLLGEAQPKVLYWALMPAIWIIRSLWSEIPDWASLSTLCGINMILLFLLILGGFWVAGKKNKKEPIQAAETTRGK